MVINGFSIFIKLAIVFGKLPWLHNERHKRLSRFMKIYPGFVAILMLLHYILIADKFIMGIFNFTGFIWYLNNIFNIFMTSYLSNKELKKLLEIFESLNSKKSQALQWKLMAVVGSYTLCFLIIRIFTFFNNKYDNVINGIMIYSNLISSCCPLTCLITLQALFKDLNGYWKNIYKWQKIGLQVKRGRNAKYCKNQYKFIYEMYLCYQKVFSWTISMSFLQFMVSLLYITNYIITTKTFNHMFWTIISVWGNHILILVSNLFP